MRPDSRSDPSQLRIQVQPAASAPDFVFAVQPTIEIQDATGRVVTADYRTRVTAAISSGGGELRGNVTATAVSGVATFTDLAITGSPGNRRLTFTADGLIAAVSVQFPLSPGTEVSQVIDADGASIALSDGAIIVVPQGAIDGEIRLRLASTPAPPTERGTGAQAEYHLEVSGVGASVSFDQGTSMKLAVPANGATPASRFVRAVFARYPDLSFWAPGSTDGANQVAVSIPATALAELASTLGGRVVVTSEANPSAATSIEAQANGCYEYPLRHLASSKQPGPGDVAIVLVHGWLWSVEDCATFQAHQLAGISVPGEIYFEELSRRLAAGVGTQHPIYVFTYPTFEHYAVVGDSLASRIVEVVDRAGPLLTTVVVAHSMGGLVSRRAASVLSVDDQYERIRAIITLGTPHLGTPLARLRWFGVFYPLALEKPGAQSMRPEAVPNALEAVPIVAYGGNLVGRNLSTLDSLGSLDPLFYRVLCAAGECSSDGIVPLASATPAFISEGRSGPVLPYAHSELHRGRNLDADVDDPLYTAITADVLAAAKTFELAPTMVFGGLSFLRLSAGGFHVCANTVVGDAYCWGDNYAGKLGNGSTSNHVRPVAVEVEASIEFIASGDVHTCGIASGGVGLCWGDNSRGQLGDGSSTNRVRPVAVQGGLAFRTLSPSGGAVTGRVNGLYPGHTCGVTVGSAAYCWGANGGGQLGDGSTTERAYPAAVAGGITFLSVRSGGYHTCGLSAMGRAYCWGQNGAGQLGDGSATPRSSPVAVLGDLKFQIIDAGENQSCGITTVGAAYCWGAGVGSRPELVSATVSFRAITVGASHTCALSMSNVAYCWGSNSLGQLGDGTRVERSTPAAVSGGLMFQSISAGAFHTCAVSLSGIAYCWGNNYAGELGNKFGLAGR